MYKNVLEKKVTGNRRTWREQAAYLLFGKPPEKDRRVYLDRLRVVATIFVICVHTVSLAATLVTPGSIPFYVLEIFNFSFLSCNLLFIMISGALLLAVEHEQISTFFAKRFSKVAVPLVVYYILYVCAKEGIEWIYPSHWFLMIQRIMTGAPSEAPHFWLIYVILFLYILTPFLRFILRHIPDSVLAGVMIVVFLINGIETYAPFWGLDSHLSLVVDTFAGVFLLGYFLSGKCSCHVENLLIAGGILSFIISCFLIVNTSTYGLFLYNNAPTMMLFSSAIFLAIKKASANSCTESLFTRLISRYSFSILLIHWGVLHFAVKQVLHVDVLSGGIIGGCLLMIVLTLILSILGAIAVDNTLILLIHTLFHKFGKLCRLLKK